MNGYEPLILKDTPSDDKVTLLSRIMPKFAIRAQDKDLIGEGPVDHQDEQRLCECGIFRCARTRFRIAWP